MPEEQKVFDIARPAATPASRPVIVNSPPATDPMVKPVAPVTKVAISTPDEPVVAAPTPEPAPVAAPAPPIAASQPNVMVTPPEVQPQIDSIPVAITPPAEPAAEASVAQINTSSAVTPALPGAPAASFADVPKFGELQAKVDAHPLFSGQKEKRVKVRRRSRGLLPLLALLAVLVIGYLSVDAGLVRGASHLPFHVFKQKTPIADVPAITQPAQTQASQSTSTTNNQTTTADPYAGWTAATLKYEKLSFKYPAGWTAKDSSVNNSDSVALSGPNGFVMDIQTGALVKPANAASQKIEGAKVVTFNSAQAYFDYVSTKNDKLIDQASLSQSSTDQFDFLATKNLVLAKKAVGKLEVTASYSGSPAPKGLNLTDATADPNYQNAILIIKSMAY